MPHVEVRQNPATITHIFILCSMDPLSIIVAIPDLIERTKSAYDFVQRFRQASDSCSKLMVELDNLNGTLVALLSHIEGLKGSDSSQNPLLFQLERNVNDCSNTLNTIQSKFDHNRMTKWWMRAVWALKDEKEVFELRQDLEKHKTYFLLILQIDTSYALRYPKSIH